MQDIEVLTDLGGDFSHRIVYYLRAVAAARNDYGGTHVQIEFFAGFRLISAEKAFTHRRTRAYAATESFCGLRKSR